LTTVYYIIIYGKVFTGLTNRFISQTAIIAALYAALTLALAFMSYGPIQIRISEALTVLPFISIAAIPGLALGCLVANLFSPVGLPDIIFGSLCTLIAAGLTYLISKTKKPFLAPLPPIIVNSLGVSLYLHFFYNLPYWLNVLYISIGEIVACYLLGYPLLKFILGKEKVLKTLRI
jgi:uncharacterized membrane protein